MKRRKKPTKNKRLKNGQLCLLEPFLRHLAKEHGAIVIHRAQVAPSGVALIFMRVLVMPLVSNQSYAVRVPGLISYRW